MWSVIIKIQDFKEKQWSIAGGGYCTGNEKVVKQ